MITDANGMPVLQPLVDDASTATFNAAFAQIGTVVGQIKSYKWANASARNAQTGMTEGDLGYQRDTDMLYSYSGSAWTEIGPTELKVTTIEPPSGFSGTIKTLRRLNTVTLHGNLAKTSAGNWGNFNIGPLPTNAPTEQVTAGGWASDGSPFAVRVLVSGTITIYMSGKAQNVSAIFSTTWTL